MLPGLQDIDAEQTVITAMLTDSDMAVECLSELEELHFAGFEYRELFVLAAELLAANRKLTLPAILERFKVRWPEQDPTAFKETAMQALGGYCATWDLSAAISRLKEKYSARQFLMRVQAVTKDIKADPENTASAIEALKTFVSDLDVGSKSDSKQGPKSFLDSLKSTRELLHDYSQGVRPIVHSTGFSNLDALTKYQPKCLYVIGARPGMGKTAFGLGQALTLCRQGLTGLFVSLEMPDGQLSQRAITAKTGLPGAVIRDGLISEDDISTVDRLIEEMQDTADRLKILDEDIYTIEDLKKHLLNKKKKNADDVKYDFIVIDYIQLLDGETEGQQNREQIVGNNSKAAKDLAKKLGIPVIALAQLSRGILQRQDKRPTLADLRDSGRIEQDADVVIFIHREDYYIQDTQPNTIRDADGNLCYAAELIVAKNRHGQTGIARVGFRPDRTIFTELQPEEQYRWD